MSVQSCSYWLMLVVAGLQQSQLVEVGSQLSRQLSSSCGLHVLRVVHC